MVRVSSPVAGVAYRLDAAGTVRRRSIALDRPLGVPLRRGGCVFPKQFLLGWCLSPLAPAREHVWRRPAFTVPRTRTRTRMRMGLALLRAPPA
jgi:hypothetical protein